MMQGGEAPKPGREYPLTLGNSLRKRAAEEFCSVRFTFKPESVHRSGQGVFQINKAAKKARSPLLEFRMRRHFFKATGDFPPELSIFSARIVFNSQSSSFVPPRLRSQVVIQLPSGEGEAFFEGAYEATKNDAEDANVECVAIFDSDTGTMRLERLSGNVTVRRVPLARPPLPSALLLPLFSPSRPSPDPPFSLPPGAALRGAKNSMQAHEEWGSDG